MDTACRICNNNTGNKSLEVPEMMFGTKEQFLYVECGRCGCVQIQDPPKNMGRFYPENYYSFSLSPERFFQNHYKNSLLGIRDYYVVKRKGILGKLLHIINVGINELKLLYETGIDKHSRILDIGCGSGMLLYRLRNAGFINLLGIDPYISNDIHYKNGLSIVKKSIEELQKRYDLVMLHHSFEHLLEPLKVLKTIFRLLDNNGICLIRIPTASSFAWKHYQKDWVQLDAPRHIFIHTIQSIEILAEQSGLKLKKVIFDSDEFQFWGSEQYKRGIPLRAINSHAENPRNSIFTFRQVKEFRKRATQLNKEQKGDQAAFILQK